MNLEQEIVAITGGSIVSSQSVQTLWSGYGEIRRYRIKGGNTASIIVKHINLPKPQHHPRGWNTDISHQRKLKSYEVERNWYDGLARQTTAYCRTPQVHQSVEQEGEIWLIMEDLNASGFDIRLSPGSVKLSHTKACLSWLAHFHGQFMNASAEGLWPIGTYWHLDTRPDEWERMENQSLKQSAKAIDTHLNNAWYQTIVHGDAKLANFCFHANGQVAAVDFQYVGRGCGMKDVAYCISSCFEDDDCERYEEELLNHYFSQLELSLDKSIDFKEVKQEWSELYNYAWADFYRFLDGWSPGHWKMHGYSERIANQVIKELR